MQIVESFNTTVGESGNCSAQPHDTVASQPVIGLALVNAWRHFLKTQVVARSDVDMLERPVHQCN